MNSTLHDLFSTIEERQANPRPGSYTVTLLEGGVGKIAQKVGEEAVEVVVASLNESDERLVSEAADLTYHLLVLLASRGLSLADLETELANRFG